MKAMRIIWLCFTLFMAGLTIVSAYGGCVDPSCHAFPAMMAMLYPAFWIATILIGVINFFIGRRYVFLQLLVLISTLPAFWSFCPLNFWHTAAGDRPTFTLMSYNSFGFHDTEEIYPDSTNRTISQIIASNADVVCLQEAENISTYAKVSLFQPQVDSVKKIYPYIADERFKSVCILSKRPIRYISLPQPPDRYASWTAGVTELGGDSILLISLHLQSLGLDQEDKEIYQQMTDVNPDLNWKSGSKTLYTKLSNAFKIRARQANMLRHQIDSLGYANVIVAGDFNDIANCYAMRTICGDNMKSVYSRVGLGPVITYHSDRFYFHIDHILYRGSIKPLKIRRGRIKSSDHYPLYATFAIE